MKRAWSIPVILLLAACNVQTKSPDGNDDVTIDANGSGNVNFNLPFAKGSIKLPANAIREGQLDIDGVKMMPGAKMTGFNVDAHDGASVVNIGFTSPRSPDEVRSYFLDQFKQKNVTATRSGDSIQGTSHDGDSFDIAVTPAAQGSQGKIVIHDKG